MIRRLAPAVVVVIIIACGDAVSPYSTGDRYRVVATDHHWYECGAGDPSLPPPDSFLCGDVQGAFTIWLRAMSAEVTIGAEAREIPRGAGYDLQAHIDSRFCYYAQGCVEVSVDTVGYLSRPSAGAAGAIRISLPHGTAPPNQWSEDLTGTEEPSGLAEGLVVTGTQRLKRRVEWLMYPLPGTP